MYGSFLSRGKTIPYCNRDFVEWHRGISHYGFWAVLVAERRWLDLLEAARTHMEDFIHSGNQRAPHITVAACGLLSKDHFTPELQQKQAAALKESKPEPFLLKAGPLDSFATAPYLTVEDPSGSLERIRKVLSAIAKEDDPAGYRPHITLGLYHDAFDTTRVVNRLQEFRAVPINALFVKELAFCAYETRNIQGPFTVLQRVAFI